ncbi:MAG TPA: prolyl oligopeptidase family serine peptidase [Longimicrobiaceae bacterium]|jgi:dipeptidyl aminopeptidase/acylaminoacyl peptidase|nr:prolyl oligopeptidase family serine peptidase [Longimicrobiaceae bacterium]
MRRSALFALALALAAAPAQAQQPAARRALAPADFDQWRSVRNETLSPDGRWVVYSLVPQVGDGEVVARSTQGGAEYRHTRGFIGRPQTRPGALGPNAGYNAPRAQVTADSRFAVFTVDPPRAEWERAQRAHKKPAEMPKASLAVMSLADGRVTLFPRVKSFKLSKGSGRWLAYLLEADSASARRDSAAAKPDSATRAAAPAAAASPGGTPRPVATDTAKGKKKDYGSTLVLRDLSTGTETRIADVVAYSLDDSGRWLGYTVSSHTPASDGVYVRALADGRTTALLTGPGEYKGLTFDEKGTAVAFASDHDEHAREKPRFALYQAPLSTLRIRRLVGPEGTGGGLLVASGGTLRFSDDGRMLAFGVAPAPLDSIPADSLADKAVFDLWTYRDARLQPQQKVEAGDDRDRSLAAVYDLSANRFHVLGSDSLQRVTVADNGRTAVGLNGLPYAVSAMWGEGGNDVYAFDTRTGARRLVARRVPFAAQLSTGGRYVAWFDADRHWHAHEIATGRSVDLTGALGVAFDQETWDTPDQPAPWGIAGWTKDDRSVLVYDRYDVWDIDPQGRRPARVVTDSVGRRGHVSFRVVDLDPDEDAIDPANPLLLRAFDNESKESGYWRDRLGVAALPQRLVMGPRQYGQVAKADSAGVYVFTQQTVRDFPDLWVSGATFADARRVSDANPQQSRYRWPTAEPVRWRSADGVELKGILYKPEDFDASKRYPMLVYYYEQLSDNLYSYVPPAGRNVINPTVYASNGYLVFEPDIHYTEGYPGPSAVKSIVPGVQSLIARGIVDPDAVGLQGQSWGGYQTAYIITQTPMFKAAMAGAPVANMTSAYGGIRWQTGLARAFQYERGQSRIGGSLWQQPMRYIENSPLFSADRVTTPLLIMANDNDGSVPWYQGIELFVALRRLGKEVYLIDYNGDEHNPTKRANQIDISVRMQQFFDHHLRGRPAPEWMTAGIPFLQKGRDQLAQPAQVTTTPAGEPPAPTPGATTTGAAAPQPASATQPAPPM